MRIFTLSFFLLISQFIFAQDFCTDAIELELTQSCDFITYDNSNLTSSGITPLPVCGSFSNGVDMWFKIEVSETSLINIDIDGVANGISDMAMQAYIGDCNNLSLLVCDDDDFNTLYPVLEWPGLPGETYYLRVYPYGGTSLGEFAMCATQTMINADVGNTCQESVELEVGDDFSFDLYTTIGLTPSGTFPEPTCGFFNNGTDIWFKATVPSSGILIAETRFTEGGLFDMAMQAYTGSCGNLSLYDCDDDGGLGSHPIIAVRDLSPGTEVFFRVYDYGGGEEGQFYASAYTIEYGPGDLCTDPIDIDVNTSCIQTVFDNSEMDPSFEFYSCIGTGVNDLWLQFEVPASGNVLIETSMVNNGLTDLSLQVLEGDCDNTTSLACEFATFGGIFPVIPLYDRTPGETLLLRIGGNNAEEGEFAICLTEIEPTTGEICALSIDLPVNEACMLQFHSTEGALPSSNIGFNCVFSNHADLWFNTSIPASGNIEIQTSLVANGVDESALEIYAGECDNLLYIHCASGNLEDGQTSIRIGGRTPGEVIYVRYAGTNNIDGEFGICAFDPEIPVANVCEDGYFITPKTSCIADTFNNIGYINSNQGGQFNCGSNGIGNDVWFNTFIPPSGNLIIETVFVDGGLFDMVLQVYNGDCENLNYLACNDDFNSGHSRVELLDMIPDEPIYFKIIEYASNQEGVFGVCAYDASAEDNDGDGFFAGEDCDDENPDINPDAEEIANNGIDEDCDGMDFISSNDNLDGYSINIYPNPASEIIQIQHDGNFPFDISLYSLNGQKILNRQNAETIDISQFNSGAYMLKISNLETGHSLNRMIQIIN